MQRIAAASLRLFFSSENYIRALPLNPVGGGRQHPTFEAKSRQKPPEGFRSPRRNKLRYAQYNQRLNCCTLRYCSLIEKILRFFRRGEAAKSFGAVVLTIAYRFELASTMRKAEPYCVPANLSFFQNTPLI